MGNIEKEIKILNIDVFKILNKLEELGIKTKGKYIQDIYTYDLPKVEVLYTKYINILLKDNDSREITKLITEIKPCFSSEDLEILKRILGNKDIIEFIHKGKNLHLLKSKVLIKLIKKVNTKFSKWIRLRKTGDNTTITIKRIVNGNGEYKIDAVSELEIPIPSLEYGKEFLEDLGYFYKRRQSKMRIAYDYKNTEIVIDKWPKISPYIEIEGPTLDEIMEVVYLLGYKDSDVKIVNTDTVYLEEGIDIYKEEYNNLDFSKEEINIIKKYME